MKSRKPINFLVTQKEFEELQNHKSHLFKTKLTIKIIEALPRAIEANEFMLVFPIQLSPKQLIFRTKDKQSCTRDILNIIATKEEDGSEILNFRLK